MTDPRPEPVLDAGRLTALITSVGTALATIAVVAGVLSQTDADTLLTAVITAVGAILTLVHAAVPLLAARQVREQVTPLLDPQTALGERLVPEQPNLNGTP